MTDSNQRPPPPGKAESLFAAWAARVEAGERIEFESVVRRHPECARELEQLHVDWQQFAPLLSRVVPGLVASESGVLVPPLASAADDDAPPSSDELFARLGLHGSGESRYRFRSVIGRGGGGVVLRVWDNKLNRALAMKVVLGREEERLAGDTPRVDGRTLSRFVDEARIAAQLNHPGIVPVHELGADETGRAFFTMKLVKGEDLARIYERIFSGEGDWNQTRALTYLLRVCEAMAYAHDKGVVHRDLKPANVMVGPYGEVHVMDWGLARVLGEKDTRDLRIRPQPVAPISAVDSFRAGEREASPDSPLVTMDGAVVGTPAYMSPEQARGELEDVGPRSDVYAVGAMLYHLLTGEPPFTPRGAHVPQLVVLTNVMHGPPKPVEELAPRAAPELVAICEKAMQRQSTSRYGSMLELAADLRAFLEGRVVAAYETGTWAETKKWVQRNKALAASLLATAVATAALTVALARDASRQEKLAMVERQARTDAEQSAARERAAAELAQANEQRAQQSAFEARAAEARADEVARAAEEDAYFAAIVGAQSALNANEPDNVRRLLDSAPERLRNWEWGYLNATLDTSLLKLEGHAANWSPDGSQIISALNDSTARVWDAASGSEIARLVGHTDAVLSAVFSPDGLRVITASQNSVRVWDASTGAEITKVDAQECRFVSASFSPDGSRIVTRSLAYGRRIGSSSPFPTLEPQVSTIRVWDATTAREQMILHGESCAGFSPDGTQLVTASALGRVYLRDPSNGASGTEYSDTLTWRLCDESVNIEVVVGKSLRGRVRVWDVATGLELAELKGHTDDVVSACFSTDGSVIMTTSLDGTSRLWTVPDLIEAASLDSNVDALDSVCSSRDGARVVRICPDGIARVWNAVDRTEVSSSVERVVKVVDATITPDGSRFVTVSADGAVDMWDANNGRWTARLQGHSDVERAMFSPDGERLLTTDPSGNVFVWDAAVKRAFATLRNPGVPPVVEFSSDGARMVAEGDGGSVHVLDVARGSVLANLGQHTGGVNLAVFISDGTRLVTTASGSFARIWDAATGHELANLELIASGEEIECLSQNGARLVTKCSGDSLRVLEVATGQELARLDGHTGYVNSASFSLDGARVVTTSDDHTARVWDVANGRELAKLAGHSGSINSAAFCGDGMRVVTASEDGSARVWDLAGDRWLSLVGHTKSVRTACFSPDGTRILTAAADGSARVWDAASGRELARLKVLELGDLSAKFSPDGTRVLTASEDGCVVVWDSVPRSLRTLERLVLEAARPEGRSTLSDALARSSDFNAAATRMRGDPSLDPIVRRAALDLLTERCDRARGKAHELKRARSEREWLAKMLGLQPWGTESEIEASLDAALVAPSTPSGGPTLIPRSVETDETCVDPVRELVLARRSLAAATSERALMCSFHRQVARALFRVGRFDEALAEQFTALRVAPADLKARFQEYLTQLEADIADWRDENGELRVAKWTAKLEELARQIAELEADPDVRMWLAYKR